MLIHMFSSVLEHSTYRLYYSSTAKAYRKFYFKVVFDIFCINVGFSGDARYFAMLAQKT
jgi:hypothetical protein